jgi:hypothetical protein
MKWYEDLLAWCAIGIVSAGLCAGSFIVGKNTVVDSCKDYRAYKPSSKEVVFCMVLPVTEQRNIGEKEYIRPDGNKVTNFFKRT